MLKLIGFKGKLAFNFISNLNTYPLVIQNTVTRILILGFSISWVVFILPCIFSIKIGYLCPLTLTWNAALIQCQVGKDFRQYIGSAPTQYRQELRKLQICRNYSYHNSNLESQQLLEDGHTDWITVYLSSKREGPKWIITPINYRASIRLYILFRALFCGHVSCFSSIHRMSKSSSLPQSMSWGKSATELLTQQI